MTNLERRPEFSATKRISELCEEGRKNPGERPENLRKEVRSLRIIVEAIVTYLDEKEGQPTQLI